MALTLRLTDDETEKLQIISKQLEKKTAAGTVAAMIHSFTGLKEECKMYRELINNLLQVQEGLRDDLMDKQKEIDSLRTALQKCKA